MSNRCNRANVHIYFAEKGQEILIDIYGCEELAPKVTSTMMREVSATG